MTSRTVWTANSDGTLTPELVVVNPESHCRTPKVAINSSCSALFGTGLECRVSSVECRVSSVECRVPSAECRVPSVECQVIKPKKLLYSFFLILWPIYTHRKSEKNKSHFHVHIFALIIPLSVRLFSFCRGSSARLARREQTNRR